MSRTDRKLFRRYRAGYEVWEETHETDFAAEVIDYGDSNGETATELDEFVEAINQGPRTVRYKTAYTPIGERIGEPRWAHRLCKIMGIRPQIRQKLLTDAKRIANLRGEITCSIGFCKREQKWYGWSHRAIFGFAVGDVAKEGDCVCSSGWTEEYLAEHPEEDLSLPAGFTAHTLDDARRMAIAFAESVG